ncbi:MAG: hypothetical protein JW776_15035 [Candidatus Lokiarchaeota archaeon]|nr:hypothetical protein [Candidatus Lokiarchaeota archaeon]
MSQKKKQSSTMLNLLLIIFGAIFLIQGVVSLLVSYFGITMPLWVLGTLGATTEAQALLGATGWSNIALGIWALIAGIAMFAEEEWALGQALVVLSLMAINAIPLAVSSIVASAWGVAYTYVYIFVGIVGVFGFIYLIATSRRYH